MASKIQVASIPNLFGKWDWKDVCKRNSDDSLVLTSSALELKGKNENYAFNFQSHYKPDLARMEVRLKYLTGPWTTLGVYFEMNCFKMSEVNPDLGSLIFYNNSNAIVTLKKGGDEHLFCFDKGTSALFPLFHDFRPEQWTCQFHTKLRMWFSPPKTASSEEATLDETMRKLCFSNQLSDFTIKCNGKEFPTHKFILSARSDVFERMFSSALKINEKDEPILDIDDISAEEMEIFLNFLYKDEIKVQDISCDILKLADKYNVKRLVNICLKHLKENIDIKNVVEITYTAFLTSKDELLQSASKFIFENRGSIKKCDVWNQIKKTHPEIAIKIMDLIVFDAETEPE